MQYKAIFISLVVLIGLFGCETESLDTKVPKVFLAGDEKAVTSFWAGYSDSLNEGSHIFGKFLQKQINFDELLSKRVNDKQTFFISRWGLNNKFSFLLRWKSAVFLLLNFPLTLPAGTFQTLETGISSSVDSIRYISIHLIAHYPDSRISLVQQKIANFIENQKPVLPKYLLYQLKSRFHGIDSVIVTDQQYPGIRIDQQFHTNELKQLISNSYANLYKWELMTYMDSTFSFKMKWQKDFIDSESDIQLLIWKAFIYHKLDPVDYLLDEVDIGEIYIRSDSHMKNEILTDLLSARHAIDYSNYIISWLQDSTNTDFEKRRILNHFSENPPDIFFNAFYEACDTEYLQNSALKLIAKIESVKVDTLLKQKLFSGKETHKVIYVIGFRKKEKSIEYLTPFLNNKNEIIRFNAREAIHRIELSKKH